MKIVFWLFIALDVGVLLLLFVLGLAAATSTKGSPLAVAGYMLLLPGCVIALAVFLFTRGTSSLARGTGLALAGAPLIIVLALKTRESIRLFQATDAEGNVTFFRAGPMREIAAAIDRNDAAAIRTLAPTTNLNKKGYANRTLLTYALRRLEDTPGQIEPIRALLEAGADPNLAAGGELPLEIAIQESGNAGPEPVRMLLAAGAKPNTPDNFGTPVFFQAIGVTVPPEVLAALIDGGADLKAKDSQGLTIVFSATNTSNWRAVLLLLERGVGYEGRTINGETFRDLMEYYARIRGDSGGIAEVLEYLKRH